MVLIYGINTNLVDIDFSIFHNYLLMPTQQTFICTKPTIEALEKGVKYAQIQQ